MFLDLLDSEVICSELGIVNAEVDASVDTCGILDLQERINKQMHYVTLKSLNVNGISTLFSVIRGVPFFSVM